MLGEQSGKPAATPWRREEDRRPAIVIFSGVGLIVALAIWAFGTGFIDLGGLTYMQREARLANMSDTIVPAHSSSYKTDWEWDCGGFELSPRCLMVSYSFENQRGTDIAGMVMETARENGWRFVRAEEEDGMSYWAEFERDSYFATAWFFGDEYEDGCPRTAPIAECYVDVDIRRD